MPRAGGGKARASRDTAHGCVCPGPWSRPAPPAAAWRVPGLGLRGGCLRRVLPGGVVALVAVVATVAVVAIVAVAVAMAVAVVALVAAGGRCPRC